MEVGSYKDDHLFSCVYVDSKHMAIYLPFLITMASNCHQCIDQTVRQKDSHFTIRAEENVREQMDDNI